MYNLKEPIKNISCLFSTSVNGDTRLKLVNIRANWLTNFKKKCNAMVVSLFTKVIVTVIGVFPLTMNPMYYYNDNALFTTAEDIYKKPREIICFAGSIYQELNDEKFETHTSTEIQSILDLIRSNIKDLEEQLQNLDQYSSENIHTEISTLITDFKNLANYYKLRFEERKTLQYQAYYAYNPALHAKICESLANLYKDFQGGLYIRVPHEKLEREYYLLKNNDVISGSFSYIIALLNQNKNYQAVEIINYIKRLQDLLRDFERKLLYKHILQVK